MIGTKSKFFSIDEIRFLGEVTITDELFELIREASPPDEDGDSVFLEKCVVDDVSYMASALVTKLDKDGRRFKISFNYKLGKGRRLPKDVPHISQLLEILSSIEEPTNFRCMVAFEFARRQKVKPIFRLPINFIDMTNAPFNEIHGVHFVKRTGRELEYEVILDLLESGRLGEAVLFGHQGKVHKSLVDEVLRKAIEISESFVLKEQ